MDNTPVALDLPTTLKPQDIRKEFDLPSGKHVIIRRGKGRDLRLALLAAGAKADQYRILFAILAKLSLVDGKTITMEAIDEMDFDDTQAFLAEAGNAISPLAKTVQKAEEQETDQEVEIGGPSSLLQ